MLAVHPYEEPAYDLIPLANQQPIGIGRIGQADQPMTVWRLRSNLFAKRLI